MRKQYFDPALYNKKLKFLLPCLSCPFVAFKRNFCSQTHNNKILFFSSTWEKGGKSTENRGETEGEKWITNPHSSLHSRLLIWVIITIAGLCEPNFDQRNPLGLCYDISADLGLKSLFRLPEEGGQEEGEDCPIQGAFQMTYSRGGGICDYPKSDLSTCVADPRRLSLRYQACADIPRTESAEERLRCLGRWKDGSTEYFLALFDRARHDDWESRFRCFAFQRIYDGFLLAQSGEAKCNLYSVKEGDRTMTLKKGKSTAPCKRDPVLFNV